MSSQFQAFGARLSETYRRAATDHGPSEEEIKDAFATLAGAWSHVAESVVTALRDPNLKDHLKEAAGSLAAALGTMLSKLGEEIQPQESAEEE